MNQKTKQVLVLVAGIMLALAGGFSGFLFLITKTEEENNSSRTVRTSSEPANSISTSDTSTVSTVSWTKLTTSLKRYYKNRLILVKGILDRKMFQIGNSPRSSPIYRKSIGEKKLYVELVLSDTDVIKFKGYSKNVVNNLEISQSILIRGMKGTVYNFNSENLDQLIQAFKNL